MFYEQRTTAPDSPADLRAEYDADLAAIVDEVGRETAAAETSVDRDRLEGLAADGGVDDRSPDLTLREAGEIVALAEGEPDPDAVVELACEHLLLGMTTAVLDVDAVESDLEIDLDAREIQQKIERRAPMSFEEFVHVQHVVASGTPD